MENGIHGSWTPGREEQSKRLIEDSHSFAMRNLMLNLRDLLKYDHRTKEGRRAQAQARLRLATATDEDLMEMAKLQVSLVGKDKTETVAEVFERLQVARARVREKGIDRSELEC